LVEQFVASFGQLDDMLAHDFDPVATQLAAGEPDEFGFKHWRPLKANSSLSDLDSIYAQLPARFPPLYERLVLTYRWAEIDLELFRFVANPPGAGFLALFQEMSKDKHLWSCLLPAGYVRFGMGPDIDYDPVCFDLGSRKKNRDCSIVKIDHEEILCNSRVKVVDELAPSFEQLVLRVVASAPRP